MFQTCIIPGCKSFSGRPFENGEYISFHLLSEDIYKSLWKLWKCSDITLTKNSRICSKHFEKKCYVDCEQKRKWRKLIQGSVPTIYPEGLIILESPSYACGMLNKNDGENIQPCSIKQGLTTASPPSIESGKIDDKTKKHELSCEICPRLIKRIRALEKSLAKTKKISRRRRLEIKNLRQRCVSSDEDSEDVLLQNSELNNVMKAEIFIKQESLDIEPDTDSKVELKQEPVENYIKEDLIKQEKLDTGTSLF